MIGSHLQLVSSERGKELAVVDLYKYRFVGYRKKDGVLKWRCSSDKSCTALIFSGPEKKIVSDFSGSHNHSASPQSKIDRQVLRESCKRRAQESVTCRPVKIIRSELHKSHEPSKTIKYADIISIRKAIYENRRKKPSGLPKPLDEALEQLRHFRLDDSRNDGSAFKDQQFIHAPANKNFVCITTASNISFLTENCAEIFADGTSEYCPRYFLQLYTLQGFINGFYVPLVYFFLNDKSKNTYIEMWKFLKAICSEISSSTFNLETLHVNFELAVHQSAIIVFPDVNIKGCRFHLGQAWWRKIQSEKSLRQAYNSNDNELGKWLKQIFGLPFLPCDEVEDAFVELISICPDESGFLFSDYVLNNYIQEGCPFPPLIWAEKPSLNPRTTNAAESFHRTYNGQFYYARPPIYSVPTILIEKGTKLNSSFNNKIKKIIVSETERLERTIKTYINYKLFKSK